MNSKTKCSHVENRRKVCGPCGRKIVFGKTNPGKFLITSKIEGWIQTYINANYNIENEKYPLAICRTCYLTLYDVEKKIFKRPIPKMPDYASLVLPKGTRKSSDDCNCYICLTGRHVAHKKSMPKKRSFKNIINTPTGRYGASNIVKLANKIKKKIRKTVEPRCIKCHQVIGKGINHKCANPQANISNIVEKLPNVAQEQIASSVIRAKVNRLDGVNRHIKDESVALSTRGSKMKVIVNPTEKKKITFPAESLDNLRANLTLSKTKMNKITNFVRAHAGKDSVPVNYREHMTKKSKLLKDVYQSGKFLFECDGNKKEERPAVFANAQELLEAVINERKFEGNVLVKITADGGQEFFKISMTIFEEGYSAELDRKVDDPDDDISPENSNRRSRYEEGGTLGKRAKVMSVKRIIILCIVPKIKETYDNVKLLFDLTQVNDISFKFVCDFKLLLIINGQQTATAMYPCPYCFISLHDLKECNEILQVDSSAASSSSCAENVENNNFLRLKTYGDLRKDYEKFEATGKNNKYAKDCHSTVNPPLFAESDDTPVLKKCVIPELHVLTGFVNHLFWKGLVPLLGRDKALIWPKKLNLTSKSYHGEVFEGNACRKLVKEADKLMDPDIYINVGSLAILPFVNAFKSMNAVVDCCFTSGKVRTGLEAHLSKLNKDFKALNMLNDVSETLKIHVLRAHVEQCLEFIEHGKGLGYWSEQTGESLHREFLLIWERYKLSSLENELYETNLLTAVIEFSSLNV